MRKESARAPAIALALVLLTGLAGCSSIGDHVPTWAGGLPEGVPDRPATPAAYPAVHDMPPSRSDTVLSEADRKKLKDDLIAARERAERNNPTTGSIAAPAAGTPPKP
jgi:hypothetical protein